MYQHNYTADTFNVEWKWPSSKRVYILRMTDVRSHQTSDMISIELAITDRGVSCNQVRGAANCDLRTDRSTPTVNQCAYFVGVGFCGPTVKQMLNIYCIRHVCVCVLREHAPRISARHFP